MGAKAAAIAQGRKQSSARAHCRRSPRGSTGSGSSTGRWNRGRLHSGALLRRKRSTPGTDLSGCNGAMIDVKAGGGGGGTQQPLCCVYSTTAVSPPPHTPALDLCRPWPLQHSTQGQGRGHRGVGGDNEHGCCEECEGNPRGRTHSRTHGRTHMGQGKTDSPREHPHIGPKCVVVLLATLV